MLLFAHTMYCYVPFTSGRVWSSFESSSNFFPSTSFFWNKLSITWVSFSLNCYIVTENQSRKLIHPHTLPTTPSQLLAHKNQGFENFVLRLSSFESFTTEFHLKPDSGLQQRKLKLQVSCLQNQEPTHRKVGNCLPLIPVACMTAACQNAAGGS